MNAKRLASWTFAWCCAACSGFSPNNSKRAEPSDEAALAVAGQGIAPRDADRIMPPWRAAIALTTDRLIPETSIQDSSHPASGPSSDTALSLLEQGQSFCSGVMVGPRLALSAAHCLVGIHVPLSPPPPLLPKPQDFIVAGGNQVRADACWGRAMEISIHPNFSAQELLSPIPRAPAHDLGALFLESDLNCGLPLASLSPLGSQESARFFLAGYGYQDVSERNNTGQLKAVYVAKGDVSDSPWLLHFGSPSTGACHGDSGAPLFQMDPSGISLLAIASTGRFGANRCIPVGAGFTDLRQESEWLRSMLAKAASLP